MNLGIHMGLGRVAAVAGAVVEESLRCTRRPALSGGAFQGQTLAVTAGAWSAEVTLSYQWQRRMGSAWVDIEDATETMYLLLRADAGHKVRVKEIALTEEAVSGYASSLATAVVAVLPAPEDVEISAGDGVVNLAWQAVAEDFAPVTYLVLRGLTDDSEAAEMIAYDLEEPEHEDDDVEDGTEYFYWVLAANAGGESDLSEGVSVMTQGEAPAAAGPVNTASPSIAGTDQVGETKTATPGVWTGVPTPTITGQWQRNDGGWADIEGETGLTYDLTEDDEGLTVRYKETASNASGDVDAYSEASGTVAVEGTDSYVYIRSTGNDSTGNGSAGAPYATFQKAINDLRQFTAFDLGAGSFGDGYFNGYFVNPNPRSGNLTITLRGVAGTEFSNVVYYTNADGGGVTFDLTIIGAVHVGTIVCGANALPPHDAGAFTLHAEEGCVVDYCFCEGGTGDSVDEGTGGTGGSGGTVNLYGPFTLASYLSVGGGPGGLSPFGALGSVGNPGSWTAHDGTITP